ncbi:right-handed parallel beta-helix repeat-containing protein [bacterium]|nr:MAG: right-handed parallel beta-helix repeat-containing protein [bacterium]
MTLLLAMTLLAPGRLFYIDGRAGSDKNPGSVAAPWQTFSRLAKANLAPGDSVILVGGQTYPGPLRLGKEANGITLRAAGDGPAEIRGGKGDGLVLDGCENLAVKDLLVSGAGRKENDGSGILMRRTRGVTIESVTVTGFRIAGVDSGGDEKATFKSVVAHGNGAAGISVFGGYDGVPRSKDIRITRCTAYENAGDPKNLTNHSGNGIIVGGVDGCIIDYCTAFRNGADMPRKGNGPVGIWAWNASNVLIEWCISHHNDSPGTDGGGFDFDGGVTDSTMQHNLSYRNAGCGYLLCQYEGGDKWKNNTVRYNVSYNDGAKNFQAGIGIFDGGGKFSDAKIYNNTVVNDLHAVSAMHAVPGLVFERNVFVSGKEAVVGDFVGGRFAENLYWTQGRFGMSFDGKQGWATLADWAAATGQESETGTVIGHLADPKLRLPARDTELPTDPADLAKMTFFQSTKGSPAKDLGLGVPSL